MKYEVDIFKKHILEITLNVETGFKPVGGGEDNFSFQDTGLCHSNPESTTHKSGEISQKYTHKSGEFLKIIPINPGMQNSPSINEFLQKTIPINPENAKHC